MKKGKGAAAEKAIVILMLVALLLACAFFVLDSPTRETKVTVYAAPSGITFSKTYGGNNTDYANSLVQTSDGGYAIIGATFLEYPRGYLVKTDENGTTQWEKPVEYTNGSLGLDRGTSIIQTSEGGYAIAGYVLSMAPIWGYYARLVKTDVNGVVQWGRTILNRNSDPYNWIVVQTGDGGYALVGAMLPGENFWLIRIDANGNLMWNKTYAGTNNDYPCSMVQTSDGGYAMAGSTAAFGAGDNDVWLVKTDASGNLQWNQNYGGTGNDVGYSVAQTSDGGFAIAGSTESFGAGNTDIYLVKTSANGNMIWNKTFGGTGTDNGNSVVQTSDGGYTIVGSTNSNGAVDDDMYLVKTDANGNMQWNKIYGGTNDDYGYSVIQARDGGYAIAGSTHSFGFGSSDQLATDMWFIKTDSDGNAPLPLGNPIIGIISREPAGEVQPSQPVKISANVADTVSQIKNVTLYYSYGGIPWQGPILMRFNASTNLYEESIPGISGGFAVQFKVVAINDALANSTKNGSPYAVTQVIPEYPSIIVLPIIIIVTLLVTLVYFKKRKH